METWIIKSPDRMKFTSVRKAKTPSFDIVVQYVIAVCYCHYLKTYFCFWRIYIIIMYPVHFTMIFFLNFYFYYKRIDSYKRPYIRIFFLNCIFTLWGMKIQNNDAFRPRITIMLTCKVFHYSIPAGHKWRVWFHKISRTEQKQISINFCYLKSRQVLTSEGHQNQTKAHNIFFLMLKGGGNHKNFAPKNLPFKA